MHVVRLLQARSEGQVFRGTYEEYLQSPWWRLHVRRQALHRANHRCQECGAIDELDVHHRTYARLGCEEPDDVLVLCRQCHAKVHGRPIPPYSGAKPGVAHIGDIVWRIMDGLTKSDVA